MKLIVPHLATNLHRFMESRDSLYLIQPATYPCSQASNFSLHLPILVLIDNAVFIFPPIHTCVFKVVSFLVEFSTKSLYTFVFSPCVLHPHPYYAPRFHYPNGMWQRSANCKAPY
jgi:hypothetical protein